MRLERVLPAIVLAVAACDEDRVAPADARAEVGAEDATVEADAADAGPSDAPIDTYAVWCEAGAPFLMNDQGCAKFVYSPCGLPEGDPVVNDAGLVQWCGPLCVAGDAADDPCAVLSDPQVIGVVLDASSYDAASLTDGGLLLLCECTGGSGRRPAGLAPACLRARSALGAHFASMAHLEAASVPAFARLGHELASLGAGPRMLRDVARAVADERRHAALTRALARRFGGHAQAPRVAEVGDRDVATLARENEIEGCVRETFGALVATWQAAHARDPHVRRAMTAIARDETRHAELAFRVRRFLAPKLDSAGRRRVRDISRATIARLRDEIGRAPHPDLVRRAGLPGPRTARMLFKHAERHVWAVARFTEQAH